MKPTPSDWPRISSSLYYRDPKRMIDWLCRAFGFEVRIRVEDEDGRIEQVDRSCGAVDPEGHLWWFSQRIRSAS